MLAGADYIHWQPPVVKHSKAKMKGHGGHSFRKAKKFEINNFNPTATTEAYYLLPKLEKKKLTLKNGLVTLPRTGIDNYHALVVIQKDEKAVRSSVRYIYSRGRPSKISPTKITAFEKSALEIEPILLPKEHSEYEGSDSYDFKVRFNRKPLANQRVTFVTSHGTKKTFTTNDDGRFSLTLPNDFKNVVMKKRRNKSAEFVLKTSYTQEGVEHTNTFSMPYYVNASDYWEDELGGAILLFLGLVLGLYLFRNINKKKKKGKA
jgi:hypothetical protein